MIPLSAFEFTPDEIRVILVCLRLCNQGDALTQDETAAVIQVRAKLKFALKRFEPGGERDLSREHAA